MRSTGPSSATRGTARAWRAAGIALALAYPFAVHYAVLGGRSEPALAILAALIGYALATALSPASPARWLLPAAGAVLALALPAEALRLLELPPILIPLALAWLFGRTLRSGRTPLVSRFAEIEQGGALSEELARYTRRLTWVWTVVLLALAAISAWLAASGERLAWSWFTNFASYALLAALFAGEYAYRRLRYRNYRHDSPFRLAGRIRLAELLRRR